MLLRIILVQLLIISSKSIIMMSTVDNSNNNNTWSDENNGDAEESNSNDNINHHHRKSGNEAIEENDDEFDDEKDLDLETRYKQLSKTLSEFNGEDDHHQHIFNVNSEKIDDRSHAGKSGNNDVYEGSGNSEAIHHHASGSTIVSDDEDFDLTGLGLDDKFGSGFTSEPETVDNLNNNDNKLVDMLSRKFGSTADIVDGLEFLSTTTEQSGSDKFTSKSKTLPNSQTNFGADYRVTTTSYTKVQISTARKSSTRNIDIDSLSPIEADAIIPSPPFAGSAKNFTGHNDRKLSGSKTNDNLLSLLTTTTKRLDFSMKMNDKKQYKNKKVSENSSSTSGGIVSRHYFFAISSWNTFLIVLALYSMVVVFFR